MAHSFSMRHLRDMCVSYPAVRQGLFVPTRCIQPAAAEQWRVVVHVAAELAAFQGIAQGLQLRPKETGQAHDVRSIEHLEGTETSGLPRQLIHVRVRVPYDSDLGGWEWVTAILCGQLCCPTCVCEEEGPTFDHTLGQLHIR